MRNYITPMQIANFKLKKNNTSWRVGMHRSALSRSRASRHRGPGAALKSPRQRSARREENKIIIARISAAQEAASAESEAHDRFHFNGQRGKRGCVNKQRGSRVLINDPRGTRGHGNNTGGTKKKSSPMISGAQFQEAASAISGLSGPHQ